VAVEPQRLTYRRLNPAAPHWMPNRILPKLARRSALRAEAQVTVRRARPATLSHPHVISQELFRGSLVRHQHGVDRTNRPLVVVLVSWPAHGGAEASTIWTPAIDAIAAATRDSDIIGWFEREVVLGVILIDLDRFGGPEQAEIERRLQRTLLSRLPAEVVAGLSIRFQVHARANGAQDREPKPVVQPVEPRRRAAVYGFVKRGLDIAGSVTLLVACAPLLAVIAAAVKLSSPGPVFFRQIRVGQGMKRFTILKFRTMSVTADHAIHHEFVSRFIRAGDDRVINTSTVFKMADDPRVTDVGRVLRKTSLDELPQLWNVLRGDMSLVGPRPPIPYEVEQYKSWHCRRVLEAKPGMTGLWQVTGRSHTTFDDMVRLDIRYARTCSFATDLKILLATPRAVIAGKGAC